MKKLVWQGTLYALFDATEPWAQRAGKEEIGWSGRKQHKTTKIIQHRYRKEYVGSSPPKPLEHILYLHYTWIRHIVYKHSLYIIIVVFRYGPAQADIIAIIIHSLSRPDWTDETLWLLPSGPAIFHGQLPSLWLHLVQFCMSSKLT